MQAPSGDLISDGPSSRLSELGIVLPAPPAPLGAYVESSDTGNLLFLSGTLPVVNGKLAIAGRLGANLSVKEGQEAARIASLNALAAAKQHLGGPGASVYVASKHAVEGLTKAAALEVAGSGVRVNVVAPGPIETGMLNRFTGDEEKKAALVSRVPLKRAGLPEEIAQTIVFLASEKASFITGVSIAVDGGKLAG